MSLNLNDPSIPGPGEMQMSPRRSESNSSAWPANPSHQRTPSLGSLHQELENEQEMQVNRLLNMIRQQQSQIRDLQNNPHGSNAIAIDDGTSTSERSTPFYHPTASNASQPISTSRPRSPFVAQALSRHSSYRSGRSSHNTSPLINPTSGTNDSNDLVLGPAATRDESAFYQAETQNLTRENQLLKQRIRELERQLSDVNPTSLVTHSPATASNLISQPINNSDAETSALRTAEERPVPQPVVSE